MTAAAARAMLAARPVRVTAAPPDDGGLIRYAERIARRREGSRALDSACCTICAPCAPITLRICATRLTSM